MATACNSIENWHKVPLIWWWLVALKGEYLHTETCIMVNLHAESYEHQITAMRSSEGPNNVSLAQVAILSH
jgi:hypothetical protein